MSCFSRDIRCFKHIGSIWTYSVSETQHYFCTLYILQTMSSRCKEETQIFAVSNFVNNEKSFVQTGIFFLKWTLAFIHSSTKYNFVSIDLHPQGRYCQWNIQNLIHFGVLFLFCNSMFRQACLYVEFDVRKSQLKQ